MAKKVSGEKFAVIKLSGSQVVVREGDLLEVFRLEGEVGKTLKVDDVLAVSKGGQLEIGTPLVTGAGVELKILEHAKGPKVEIRKFRAKSRYRRKTGHRQSITKVQVVSIKV